MANMDNGLKSFVELIEKIADNKFILGDHLVKIGVSGPTLEATLAAVGMAQGELGHARLLYNWAFDLKGLEGKKQEIKSQTGKAFPFVVNVNSWISLIAGLYTVNVALDLVLRSLLKARRSEIAHRIQKLLNEQKEHIGYSRGWAGQLLAEQGAIPKLFNEALAEVIPQVEDWIAGVENSEDLIAAGYLLENGDLKSQFRDEIKKLKEKKVTAHVR